MLAPLPGCKPSPHIGEDVPPILWQARSGPVLSQTAEMLSVTTLRTQQRGVCPLLFFPALSQAGVVGFPASLVMQKNPKAMETKQISLPPS